MSPGYDYAEGEAPLPARRCPRCGGPLTQIERGLVAPKSAPGWFRPSRLQPSIWIYRSGEPAPAGDSSTWRCPTDDLAYTVLAKA